MSHLTEAPIARLNAMVDSASQLAHGSSRALQHRSDQARDATMAYVQKAPLQALLIAAAAGAAVMWLSNWLAHREPR